ncbi:MAG: hypothetical protein ACRDWD_01055 [Acidimicrobiia bacterium]
MRGRFTRLAEALTPADRQVLYERMSDPTVLTIVDPRPMIRAAGAIQNTYAVSLLQAETLAAAVTHDWAIRFGNPDSASAPLRQAADELGLDLAVIER